MELFNPWVGIIVQIGSGMVGVSLGMFILYRKDYTIGDFISVLKIPVAITIVCYTIGAINLYLRFS